MVSVEVWHPSNGSIYIYVCVCVKIVTQRVKIQSVNFFMLLFGNESLISLVYINIRHKLTG